MRKELGIVADLGDLSAFEFDAFMCIDSSIHAAQNKILKAKTSKAKNGRPGN